MDLKVILLFLILLCIPGLLFADGYDSKGREDFVKGYSSTKVSSLENIPIEAHQNELLELAFDIASSIPVVPHIKDRSRAQELVVKACLELGQPLKALGYIEKIDNWRRGTAYADLAFYCAQSGNIDKANEYLKIAADFSETIQDWPRGRIKVKIARAHAWMGQNIEAEQFEEGVEDFEKGKVIGTSVMVCDQADFDKQIKALEELILLGNFDVVKNVLISYTCLFDRFYDDVDKRSQVEERIKTLWSKQPLFTRINLLMDMAGIALKHCDQGKALELVDEAQFNMDGANWPVRYHISLIARLSKLRFKAGDVKKAQTKLDGALELFNSEIKKIVNIDRAEVLCLVAEAYQAMGENNAALAVYKRAVKESVENPNSRPRAEDLSATCCSMALHEMKFDAQLWPRIHEIYEGLGKPW